MEMIEEKAGNEVIIQPSSVYLFELRLAGYDGLVGFVDEMEKTVYLPSSDSMRNRLKGIDGERFKEVMEAYMKAGDLFREIGYNQRFILDW